MARKKRPPCLSIESLAALMNKGLVDEDALHKAVDEGRAQVSRADCPPPSFCCPIPSNELGEQLYNAMVANEKITKRLKQRARKEFTEIMNRAPTEEELDTWFDKIT